MHAAASFRPRLVETLYHEAIELSDVVRECFDLSDAEARAAPVDDPYKLALSCEALRATTRMMHAVAWLLNNRAFHRGQMSEFQLRRTGGLTSLPERDPNRIALLPTRLRALVEQTEAFYNRLLRLQAQWNAAESGPPPAVDAMQRQIAEAFRKAS
ncbi:DUF1465 family protein [Pseudoblastomonas halimionae]|uniref:DUF1465 family protein n=1 Tax=Alteriqipengyuania halimionae TaxID=1926630 RepID=A0A6I4U897_9SPHN|nr:DUF1465 family protein [Alteriqipengyuania halimionae]MXP10487.1 DUF1465 family protein [Alteriqipengyuania halimionae]